MNNSNAGSQCQKLIIVMQGIIVTVDQMMNYPIIVPGLNKSNGVPKSSIYLLIVPGLNNSTGVPKLSIYNYSTVIDFLIVLLY